MVYPELTSVHYYLALRQTPGIGDVLCRRLVEQFGSVEAVYNSSEAELMKVNGMSQRRSRDLHRSIEIDRIDDIIKRHDRANIHIHTPDQLTYPKRLLPLEDTPIILYTQGRVNLNTQRIISIIGTRRPTSYGIKMVEHIIQGLAPYTPLIVSGLAYGIDICAHRVAYQYNLPTLAVLAGGLNKIYPELHYKTAVSIQETGGIISEHPLDTKNEPYQFAARNRIIASLSDATIIIEAGSKSGALITARYANEYSREVFSIPGEVGKPMAAGCNNLIRTHQAHLLSDVQEIVDALGWDRAHASGAMQYANFSKRLEQCSVDEQTVVQALIDHPESIDRLIHQTKFSSAKLAGLLLKLECKHILKMLPGKVYKLNC